MPHPNTGKPLIERLLALTKVGETPDDCWEWQGARTASNWHGIMTDRGRRVLVHRVSFEHYVGLTRSDECSAEFVEATTGFEPVNRGFADLQSDHT